MKISKITLKVIQDSRGKDTLRAEIFSNECKAIATVPAGKSKGKFETSSIEPAIALQKFEGIKRGLLNVDFSSILEFDNLLKKLDSTDDKSNLGGNLILVLSIAFTKLLAKSNNLETYQMIEQVLGKKSWKFPYLYFNLIGGGLHAKDSLPFQEYILVTKFNSPAKGLEYAKSAIEKLRGDIEKNFSAVRVGDEGAFAIKSDDPRLGLEVLSRNLDDANISLALDVAASTFYRYGEYEIGESRFSTDQLIQLYQDLVEEFRLLSIEDPFSEDDRKGFIKICQTLSNRIWIIADDLTVTNSNLIKKAADEKAATGVIIKPNQIGSVSETLDAIKISQNLGWKVIVSHRSGETDDDFIADLAFGVGADGLKSGAPTQTQRLTKYNRLVEIERNLNK